MTRFFVSWTGSEIPLAVLPIRLFPDPVLRTEAEPVDAFDDELTALVESMLETMKEAPGVGLAAPQVGISRRIAVVNPDPDGEESEDFVLINPEILDPDGSAVDSEGCLSIPDFTEKVARATSIRLKAQNLSGEMYELQADDFLARVIQHEVDHLDGILFVDRLRGLRKERGRRHLKRLIAAATD